MDQILEANDLIGILWNRIGSNCGVLRGGADKSLARLERKQAIQHIPHEAQYTS